MFNVSKPDAAQVDFEEIAVALAMQCRFNGHCSDGVGHGVREGRFYSVAHHCVVMSREIPKQAALYALLHDAAEAFVGDMPAPVKALFPDFAELEDRILLAIYEAAGIEAPSEEIAAMVHEYDLRMLLTERAQLMAPPPLPWDVDWLHLDPLSVILHHEAAGSYKAHFLQRLWALGVAVDVEML